MYLQKTRPEDNGIIEVIKGLLVSEVTFQEIYRKYKKGSLRFSDVGNWISDSGNSLLYTLKERCHTIFRNGRTGTFQNKESLLDLAVGSIFHEAMKLRENIYQLEIYLPRYEQYKQTAGQSLYEKDYLQRFEKIISRADQGLREGMEETRSLFRDALAQLRDVFRELRRNPRMVRFLLENQPLLRRVYGSKGMQELFHVISEKGLTDAYALAGKSYLESEHYDLSALNFSKALKRAPRSKSLRSLLNFSLGMDAYYKNAYTRSLFYFEKLNSSDMRKTLKSKYVKRAGEVCLKISSDLRVENQTRGAKRAGSLAQKLGKS
jgi:tetratricopeptide (TPR) repeat protein